MAIQEKSTILISIVSHQQGDLAARLLEDIEVYCSRQPIRVVITHNRPEKLSFPETGRAWPVSRIANREPKGYGANHNQAFNAFPSAYFCALNPDLRLQQDPFPTLLARLEAKALTGVISPLVLNPEGGLEDNARRLLTPGRLARRILGVGPRWDYTRETKIQTVDWLAGMFLLFPSAVYRRLNGFDERYFLYCEDVDLGCRLRLAGLVSEWDPAAAVIHEPRRSSHRSPRHLFWHLSSLVRWFRSPVYAACRRQEARQEA